MPGIELWWLGQTGFRLRDPAGGPVVFVDPFLVDRPDRTWPAPVGAEELAHADMVLCTHEHTDHFDRPSLRAAAETPGARFTLVVPSPIVDEAVELGIPRERVIGARPDEPIVRNGVSVFPVPARHGKTMADAYTFGEGVSGGEIRYLGYVVEVGGVRAYHAGDCIPYDGQVERVGQYHPHLALLPINGRDYYRETERNIVGNMDPREAARLANDLGVQALVPTHWDIFARNRGFPGDLVSYAVEEFPRLTILVLGRGARVTWTPSAETPQS